ncbi:hypothetical protein O1Q96_00990 (plasmid) [Streptomyces sp. Qhu-G9]|uniref:hypothetical protein n=1 Tax=Streptomyces sp. Qhu-G9 TaxID=3452799 RepID=UPI0022AC3513|nr:hypothetical protein [Streptomyces aurantiacus]WAU78446.1 hypothetical protein O1Q96_00990 [Streptomyces aurantiacus]
MLLTLFIAIIIVGTLFVLTGRLRTTQSDKANIAAMEEADATFNANLDRERTAGITYETTEYRRLSHAANEATAVGPHPRSQ